MLISNESFSIEDVNVIFIAAAGILTLIMVYQKLQIFLTLAVIKLVEDFFFERNVFQQ